MKHLTVIAKIGDTLELPPGVPLTIYTERSTRRKVTYIVEAPDGSKVRKVGKRRFKLVVDG